MLVEAYSDSHKLFTVLINQSSIFLENAFKFEELLISLGMLFHIIGPKYERLSLDMLNFGLNVKYLIRNRSQRYIVYSIRSPLKQIVYINSASSRDFI